MIIGHLLDQLKVADIHLVLDGQRIIYNAPSGGLTKDLAIELRRHKPALLQLLTPPEPPPAPNALWDAIAKVWRHPSGHAYFTPATAQAVIAGYRRHQANPPRPCVAHERIHPELRAKMHHADLHQLREALAALDRREDPEQLGESQSSKTIDLAVAA